MLVQTPHWCILNRNIQLCSLLTEIGSRTYFAGPKTILIKINTFDINSSFKFIIKRKENLVLFIRQFDNGYMVLCPLCTESILFKLICLKYWWLSKWHIQQHRSCTWIYVSVNKNKWFYNKYTFKKCSSQLITFKYMQLHIKFKLFLFAFLQKVHWESLHWQKIYFSKKIPNLELRWKTQIFIENNCSSRINWYEAHHILRT